MEKDVCPLIVIYRQGFVHYHCDSLPPVDGEGTLPFIEINKACMKEGEIVDRKIHLPRGTLKSLDDGRA
jgi:hypothetical protein